MPLKLITACLALLVGSIIIIIVAPAASFAADEPYADVEPDAWFHDEVTALAEAGIFEGTDCEQGFCPGRPLKRWQMAVWMIRVLEEDQDLLDTQTSRFADVEDNSWWIKYVEKLADLEITVGCKSEPLSYCPERAVSRAQMAAFLNRAFELPAAEEPAGFEDVDNESWAVDYINALAASKITVGCKSEPLLYCPSREASKAQMAVFLARALKWQAEQTAEPEPEEPTGGGGGGSFGGGGSSGGGGGQQSQRDDDEDGDLEEIEEAVVVEEIPPGGPLFLMLNWSSNHIIISWQESQDGDPVDNYLLNWRTQGGIWSADTLLAANARVATIADPQPGAIYEVRVTASNSAGSTDTTATIAIPFTPGQPRNVYAAREDANSLWIRWQPPENDGGAPLTKYIVQWKPAGQDFDSSRQAEVTDLQKLWHTVADAHEGETYSVRVIAANEVGLGDQSGDVQENMLDRSLLLLEDREVQNLDSAEMSELGQLLNDQYWRYIENEVVPAYEGRHAWIREAWSHTKQEVSTPRICMPKICSSSSSASLAFDCRESHDPDSDLSSCRVRFFFVKYGLTNLEFIVIHELAHVLTLSNQAASHPGSLAMASLYFVEAAKDGSNCDISELYADTLEATVFGQEWSTYWFECSTTPSIPPQEALEVARNALKGQIPVWFTTKYGTGNDWDYAAIWQDVNRIDSLKDRIATAYNLRNQFGGYCSPSKVIEEIYTASNADTVGNPWRNGGCTP